MKIKKIENHEIEELVSLFVSYLQFYEVNPISKEKVHDFLKERLKLGDSEILIAKDSNYIVGFAQLYPTYSSLSLQKQWILNDLFVTPESRGKGIAQQLLLQAEKLSSEMKSKGLTLQTGVDNIHAQKLYEKNGWKKSENFITYFLNH